MSGTGPAAGPCVSSTNLSATSAVSTGLEPETGWNGNDWKLGHSLNHQQDESVIELSRAEVGPGQSRLGNGALHRQLGCKVGEHGTIDAAHDGDAVGPNHRDIHEMLHPGPLCGPHQVADLRRVLADLSAGGAVQDHLGTVDRGLHPLVLRQVSDDVLESGSGLMGMST